MAEQKPSRPPIAIRKKLGRLPYSWNEKKKIDPQVPPVARIEKFHGEKLLGQLKNVEAQAKSTQISGLGAEYLAEKGMVLTFTSHPALRLKLESFESPSNGVELLNVKRRKLGADKTIETVTVFIREGKLAYLIKKVQDYKESGRNGTFAEPIETIGLAAIEELWTSSCPIPAAGESVWWEIWLRRGVSENTRHANISAVKAACDKHSFDRRESLLTLPEHTVILIKADRSAIAKAHEILNCVSEIRFPVRLRAAGPLSLLNLVPIYQTLAYPHHHQLTLRLFVSWILELTAGTRYSRPFA